MSLIPDYDVSLFPSWSKVFLGQKFQIVAQKFQNSDLTSRPLPDLHQAKRTLYNKKPSLSFAVQKKKKSVLVRKVVL